jgi:hypothetical protein
LGFINERVANRIGMYLEYKGVKAGQVANNKRAGVNWSSGWDSLMREWLIERGYT